MKLNDGYLRFAMATITAAIVCIVAVAILAPHRPDVVAVLEVLKEWQELIGGALTLLAAGYAASYVVEQMRQAQSLEDARIARARRAWLGMMPEAMSRVCEYAEDSYIALLEQHAVAASTAGLSSANNPISEAPVFDDRILPEIRALIEVAGPDEADAYVVLLSDIQVHRVRWRGRQQTLKSPHDNVTAATIENEMVEAAELYARASNLLGAARPNATAEDRKATTRSRSLFFMGGHRDPLPAVGTMANQRDIATPLTVP